MPFKKPPAILSVALLFLSIGGHAFAQSNGLGVTPKQSYTMKAGEQATNSLFLSNLNKTQPLTVQITVVDFEAQDETGTAKLLKASDQQQTAWSLKPYITIADVVNVPPGANKQVPFTLKLPANVGAGTYYSAIEYTASTGSGQQQVNIAASTATLLFINVPGEARELLTLQSFGMTNGNSLTSKYSSVFHAQPEFFAYKMKNSGNVAESPAGSIIIKNIFGKTVATIDNANPKAQIGLIGQTRKFTGCNPKDRASEKLPLDNNCTALKLSPGFYSATLAILYGQNGQPTRQIGATAHFWYLPWSSVIILLIVLLALAWVIYRLYRRMSRR
ncbi:MAG: hypothetical protein JWO96_724 [Candidatus Saccharibacteria bacterium]|nr:hypothetical protein [Candidatus Saccharibacteria bacterium]